MSNENVVEIFQKCAGVGDTVNVGRSGLVGGRILGIRRSDMRFQRRSGKLSWQEAERKVAEKQRCGQKERSLES